MRSGKKPPEDASVAREVASAMFVSFMLGLTLRDGSGNLDLCRGLIGCQWHSRMQCCRTGAIGVAECFAK